ncbi:hypothetical protein Lal_00040129 [Lupinus albus]|nr:hypothetical protein Lal_00040129 [Lupinus albus]
MLQVEFSRLGTVLPPGNNKEAIPLEATVNTIVFELSMHMLEFSTYVFYQFLHNHIRKTYDHVMVDSLDDGMEYFRLFFCKV